MTRHHNQVRIQQLWLSTKMLMHDATYAIFLSITYISHYVLDTDIAACFDQINQEKLVEKLNPFPQNGYHHVD